jgi:hypothetical protein
MRRAVPFIVLACFLTLGASRGDEPPSKETIQETRRLQQQMGDQFRDKKFEAAAETCREFIKLLPKDSSGHYNLACALAQMKKPEEALAALAKSIEIGYSDATHMRKDEDLISLRENKAFADLVAKAFENRRAQMAKLPVDKGADIAGVKTVEGNPDGGLRYRLRLAEKATAEKPQRLVIWLHPSGASMNNVVEALAPRLAAKGFALLVLTQKPFAGWSEDDATQLLDKTLPDVAKMKEIDVQKPILFGYSAGGQMALELYYAEPSRWGGLVLDAAYPVQRENGRFVPRPLPKMEGIKRTPILVLVGDKDGGSPLWKKVAPEWREKMVPLTIRHIEGKGHTWLFGKEEVELLERWLGAVAAGKKPADSEEK